MYNCRRMLFRRKILAKYDPIYLKLKNSDEHEVRMTFEQVSDLVGGLPESAYK